MFYLIDIRSYLVSSGLIRQPITFDYFEHESITDWWVERATSVQAREKTNSFFEKPFLFRRNDRLDRKSVIFLLRSIFRNFKW